jgi:hypothetical protein
MGVMYAFEHTNLLYKLEIFVMAYVFIMALLAVDCGQKPVLGHVGHLKYGCS